MEQLFKTIDELQPVYKQFWKDIVSIETPSREAERINQLVDFIADFAESRGFRVTRHPDLGMGAMLTVETVYDSGRAPFTFMGHMDTVHPVGTFGPEVVREEDGKLRGPGVVDCKGGLACAMLTMEALTACGYKEHPLKLIMTPDEEIGARTSQDFIAAQNAGAVALFNCETGTEGKLTTARKGIGRVKVEVTGRAAHAGNNYFHGVSAIRECCFKIPAIEAMSERGGTTFNCGIIQGGTVPNAVAEYCWFQVDIRALTKEAMEEAVQKVCDIAQNCTLPGAVGKATPVSKGRPPFERNEATDRLFLRIQDVAHRYGLEEFEPQGVGGGSDVVYAAMAGVPAVCSTGVCGSGTHSVREAADIASLARRAKVMGATIKEFDD